MTTDEQWFIKFFIFSNFIVLNDERPPRSGLIDGQVDEEIKTLCSWIYTQLCNYKDKKE
jgi:hypothetical protein